MPKLRQNRPMRPMPPIPASSTYWPAELTDSEQQLKQFLTQCAGLGAMLYGYVLTRGRHFSAAARPPHIKRGVPRECYKNAAELAFDNPDKYAYVEGYAQAIITTPHAWVVTKDNQVIDPTWENTEQAAYYGIPFDTQFLRERIFSQGFWGIFGEMPTLALLQTSRATMTHSWWRQELVNRQPWDVLEELLDQKGKARA